MKNIIIIGAVFALAFAVLIHKGRSINPGVEQSNTPKITSTSELSMNITSVVFEQNQKIPSKYTCDGENINPPITISDVPEGAKSLVLIMDDPDAVKPAGQVWDHWVVWNIPPDETDIPEGKEPNGVHGTGTGGNSDYSGPCPPDTEHTYHFSVYAVDAMLDIPEGSTKSEVLGAMEGHILEKAELLGRYTRK